MTLAGTGQEITRRPGVATRQRILEAAERLFAEHGLTGVSLRTITAEAEVNIAAIHYHFGTKEELIEEVFARGAKPIAKERLTLLDACREGPGRPPLVDQIVEAFLAPGLRGDPIEAKRNARFARLRARLTAETSSLGRRLLSKYFDKSSRRFLEALGRTLPDLPKQDLYWRFHCMLGALVYTMANPGRIQALTRNVCDPADVEEALDRLVPIVSAMFQAPPRTRRRRRK